MKKPIILLFSLVGILLIIGGVVFWPARAVPKSSSKQTTRYDPVKNVTYISKDGDTICVAGNHTNDMEWKAEQTMMPNTALEPTAK
jgi:hypothetical protein